MREELIRNECSNITLFETRILTSQEITMGMFTVVPCTLMLSKFYLPTDALKSCFKRILKFTLKQLLHVSVQSPSSGSVFFELAKVIIIKIIS